MNDNNLAEKLQATAEKIRNEYKVVIKPGELIELFVDGLCENPGAMHVGLHARQGGQVLFAEHLAVGNGTCNEAEYIALKSGLTILQLMSPTPVAPIQCYSDSQLVVKQVAGEWRSSGQMRNYCVYLLKLRRTFPFELKKIPRTENQLADSLAQKHVSKNSGRCLSLEQGRFNVSKEALATVKESDAYNALTSEAFREYFNQYNMHDDLKELVRRANDGDKEAAVDLAHKIGEKATDVLQNAPKTNEMTTKWVENTIVILKKCVAEILQAIEDGEEVDLQYIVDEMSGAENAGEVFDTQVAGLKSNAALHLPEPCLQGEVESDE